MARNVLKSSKEGVLETQKMYTQISVVIHQTSMYLFGYSNNKYKHTGVPLTR